MAPIYPYLFNTNNMYSSADFNFLRDAGFIDTFKCVENAMKYYYSDPSVSCSLFRKALESTVEDVYKLLKVEYSGDLRQKINNLIRIVPSRFYDENIVQEMTNIRIIGNAYIHDSRGRDIEKDRLTCYVAMKKISEWIVNVYSAYPSYLLEVEAERKRKKVKRKKFWKTAGEVAAAIIAVMLGKKMFDNK